MNKNMERIENWLVNVLNNGYLRLGKEKKTTEGKEEILFQRYNPLVDKKI